jgi:hypothetical protein
MRAIVPSARGLDPVGSGIVYPKGHAYGALMALVNLIVALALLQFFAFATAVGVAREKYNVAAPATTGNEVFERYFRVQMNTMELLIMFVPAIWLFGFYVSAHIAAGLGAVYLIGRGVYFFSYVKDPKKRSLGFGLSAGPVVALLIGALVGAAIGVTR